LRHQPTQDSLVVFHAPAEYDRLPIDEVAHLGSAQNIHSGAVAVTGRL
jgi:hypothetical protein